MDHIIKTINLNNEDDITVEKLQNRMVYSIMSYLSDGCHTVCDNVCDPICDKICDNVCNKICGMIVPCDKVCEQICDTICDVDNITETCDFVCFCDGGPSVWA